MTHFLKCLRVCFFGGLLIVAVSLLTMCSSQDSSTSAPAVPVDSGGPKESEAMKQLSQDLIVALKAEDKNKVLDLASPEYKAILAGEMNGSSASMAALGIAMEQRKLVSASALYAEYEVVVKGQTFSIAIAQCGDDKWQLVRF